MWLYSGEKVMVFLHDGFIFVGDIYADKKGHGDCMWLEKAMNCRFQETGKGWGWVAAHGQEHCITDDYSHAPVRFNRQQLLFTIGVPKEKWALKEEAGEE